MAERYQSSARNSTKKFEVVGRKEVAVRLPLPLVEVWEDLQPQVERLTGEAGLQTLRAILDDEVTRRVGPPHRPDPESSSVRWGRQAVGCVFCFALQTRADQYMAPGLGPAQGQARALVTGPAYQRNSFRLHTFSFPRSAHLH